MSQVRIGYVGSLELGGTCYSRLQALKSVESKVFSLDVRNFASAGPRTIWTRLWEQIPEFSECTTRINKEVLSLVEQNAISILWVDKGTWIRRDTIKEIRRRGVIIVHHLTDSLWPKRLRLRLTRRHLAATAPLYDYYITSNEQDLKKLKSASIGEVMLTDLGFDDQRFSNILEIDREDNRSLAHEVVFVGHREPHTERGIVALLNAGLPVTVFGQNWIRRSRQRRILAPISFDALGDDDYVKVLRLAKIGLCFVSRWNYNQTAGRSYEIPACGTLLLAMRTARHQMHYKEGSEAEFFESDQELVDKVRKYLNNPIARKEVSAAGQRRCLSSGYSWREIMLRDWAQILEKIHTRKAR